MVPKSVLAHVLLQVEKVMKALYVRKLFLWPRFQATVKEALEDRVTSPADVRVFENQQVSYCTDPSQLRIHCTLQSVRIRLGAVSADCSFCTDCKNTGMH